VILGSRCWKGSKCKLYCIPYMEIPLPFAIRLNPAWHHVYMTATSSTTKALFPPQCKDWSWPSRHHLQPHHSQNIF